MIVAAVLGVVVVVLLAMSTSSSDGDGTPEPGDTIERDLIVKESYRCAIRATDAPEAGSTYRRCEASIAHIVRRRCDRPDVRGVEVTVERVRPNGTTYETDTHLC